MAARASLLSAASRVAYPSSFNTPAINIRMSASSSTIRMSCAMADRIQFHWHGGRRGAADDLRLAGEDQPHPSAAGFAIRQHQLPMMIFHDLLHDGEAQPGAFRTGRDVGLGQALAVVPRQAFAIVLDGDCNGSI